MSEITLAVVDGYPTTTSNQIAEHFGKRHDTVLRAIANLDCSPDFTDRNFAASEYTDATGRTLPCYRLTRDGFTFLCMGFTGRDAAAWKERYIAAFNAMEAELRKLGAGETVPALPQARPERIGKDLRGAINRKAHEIALKQYDTIQAIITEGVDSNLACGATPESAIGYVESFGNRADGVAVVNVRDLQEIAWNSQQVINTAASAIAAMLVIERRTGLDLILRIPRDERLPDDFRKLDRLVDEVVARMAGETP